jgi:aspartate/methionine/tyrosine aminotransferase
MVRGHAARELRRAARGFLCLPQNRYPESDEIFVKELIRQKHVMVVHGSGFGQKPGTQHFRIVFLPDEKTLTKAYAGLQTSFANAPRGLDWRSHRRRSLPLDPLPNVAEGPRRI